jgi:hypothetical protein
MYRALLAHPQEALHKRRVGDLCAVVGVGWSHDVGRLSCEGKGAASSKHGTHCIGGWDGPRAGLDRCGKSRPPPGFDPRTVQPVASSYTD